MTTWVVAIQVVALQVLLAATVLPGCAGPASAPAISIVTADLVPEPLYEDDPDFGFRIYFEGDVTPEAGGISVLVQDQYGQVYKRLDRVVRAQADGTLASVSVPMLYDLTDLANPVLPAPGPIRIQIWDGAAYDTSTLRDETTVELTMRGVIESGGLAGGGPLSRGVPTIIWGVNPRIDPTDPGLIYQGNVDIWTMRAASAHDVVTVEYGDFNGTLDTQFASVYLRDAATGDYVARNTARVPGTPTSLTVPADGDYLVYVVHTPTSWADAAEYRVTWN